MSEQILGELVVFELLNAKATELVQEAREMITSNNDPEQYLQDNTDRLRGILNVPNFFHIILKKLRNLGFNSLIRVDKHE